MGWKFLAFGSDTPSSRQYLAYGLLYLALASVLHGMACDFVPNPVFMGGDAIFWCLVLGVLLTFALICYAIARDRMRLFGFKAILGLLIFPFLMGAFAWLVIAKSVPWLVTVAVGDNHEQAVTLRTHYSYSRRGCDYRLEGDYLEQTFPSYLCIPRSYYELHPEQVVQVRLSGEQTMLGFRIAHIRSAIEPIAVPGRRQ